LFLLLYFILPSIENHQGGPIRDVRAARGGRGAARGGGGRARARGGAAGRAADRSERSVARGAERGGAGARGRDGWAAWRGRGKYNAATALLPAGINQRTAMPKCHQLALAAALLLSCAPVTVAARSAAPDLHRVGNRLMDKTTGQPCEPQGWCRVESFSLHLGRGVSP